MKDYDLYRIRRVMSYLNDYIYSDECVCKTMRYDSTKYGSPPCLQCQSVEAIKGAEDFLLMKAEDREPEEIIVDDDPNFTNYHWRG